VVARLLALRGVAGEFVVPSGHGRASWGPLLAYNRLRPRRVRLGRAASAAMIATGLGWLIGSRRAVTAEPGDPVLVHHLAAALGESELVVAGTDRPCRDFVTPVLQLLTPSGHTVGFAKIGWDPVTAAMIDAEANALRRVRAVAPPGLTVPELLWHGEWSGLAILVTAPMPTDVRRMPKRATVPVDPLARIAAVDGPPASEELGTSDYLRAAMDTAVAAATVGRHDLLLHAERVASDFGPVTLRFGRWHGDWVPWNLARARGGLVAWDWAYSTPGVPLGFDALHFVAIPSEVLDGQSRSAASARAAELSAPALDALGIDREQQRAVVALHRLELELRDARAWLRRREEQVAARVASS